jgi:hypothetical protein
LTGVPAGPFDTTTLRDKATSAAKQKIKTLKARQISEAEQRRQEEGVE